MRLVKPIQVFCKWSTGALTPTIVNSILANSDIGHVQLGRYLKDLWPEPNRFNFQPLIDDLNKFKPNECLKLGVEIAFGQAIPNWFYDESLNPNLPVPYLDFIQTTKPDGDEIETVRQPIFFHPNFIHLAKTFISALTAALKVDSTLYRRISMITIPFLNTTFSSTLGICWQPARNVNGTILTDAPAVWTSYGLTLDIAVDVFEELSQFLIKQMHDKRLTIPLHSPNHKAFPDLGGRDFNEVIVDRMAKYPQDKFSVMDIEFEENRSYYNTSIFLYAPSKGIRVGHQLFLSRFGDNLVGATSFQAALQHSYDLGSLYVRMSDNNATKASYLPGIHAVKIQFPKAQ